VTVTGEQTTYRGFPASELIDDFRSACISRAIDDREIAMQKQSRVFFQISGAGHEALVPATTGSSPTTAIRPSCSASA
jgi:TPP-dependent pyruvate/acetoin dehydrogenase alpha subunit